MQSFLQDLRFGLRMLLRSPASSAVAIIALALGIGANTAIFSLVEAVLLKPLPYHDPDRLVQVWEDATAVGFPRNTPAPANVRDWQAMNQVFEDMAYGRDTSVTLTGVGEPETLVGRDVTANTFSVLGVRPLLGRVFAADEEKVGAAPVAVISYKLWQRRFGGEPAIVGRAVEIDGHTTTIIGVMPREFVFPARDREIWTPLQLTPEAAASRTSHYLHVVARLKPGVTVARAASDMKAIAARLERDHPESNHQIGSLVVPLSDEVVGDLKPALMVLLVAVGCVLLIACANVANLLLSRATLRRREIAVRLALGARRGRIVRQLLTESVLLAGVGGALGLGIALWSFDFLDVLIPEGTAAGVRLGLDAGVLGFTLLCSLATGVIFGLAPALASARQDLADQIKGGSPNAATGRLRGALVVAETALAFLLLAGAGLMVQAFFHVRNLDPGFRPENVLTARTALPSPRYDDVALRTGFYDRVLARIQALPGVVSAGYMTYLPLTMPGGTSGFLIEGQPPPPPGTYNDANYREVSADYQKAMGIPLRAGRFLDARDRADAPMVMLVNEAFVHKFFKDGEDPIGKRLRRGGPSSPLPWITIVGVVGDVRNMGLEAAGREEMYFPYAQSTTKSPFWWPKDLVIRTSGDPTALAESVRKVVWEIDPLQPVANVRPMEQLLDHEVVARRTQARLLGAFAGLALVLASLGIYGVLSYAVAQRRREIGIRMALGARGRRVVAMIVGQGMRLCLLGIAIGLAGALAGMRLLSSLLYGVSATDPLTYVVVGVALALVAFFASFWPARQAARVDPMITLKAE